MSSQNTILCDDVLAVICNYFSLRERLVLQKVSKQFERCVYQTFETVRVSIRQLASGKHRYYVSEGTGNELNTKISFCVLNNKELYALMTRLKSLRVLYLDCLTRNSDYLRDTLRAVRFVCTSRPVEVHFRPEVYVLGHLELVLEYLPNSVTHLDFVINDNLDDEEEEEVPSDDDVSEQEAEGNEQENNEEEEGPNEEYDDEDDDNFEHVNIRNIELNNTSLNLESSPPTTNASASENTDNLNKTIPEEKAKSPEIPNTDSESEEEEEDSQASQEASQENTQENSPATSREGSPEQVSSEPSQTPKAEPASSSEANETTKSELSTESKTESNRAPEPKPIQETSSNTNQVPIQKPSQESSPEASSESEEEEEEEEEESDECTQESKPVTKPEESSERTPKDCSEKQAESTPQQKSQSTSKPNSENSPQQKKEESSPVKSCENRAENNCGRKGESEAKKPSPSSADPESSPSQVATKSEPPSEILRPQPVVQPAPQPPGPSAQKSIPFPANTRSNNTQIISPQSSNFLNVGTHISTCSIVIRQPSPPVQPPPPAKPPEPEDDATRIIKVLSRLKLQELRLSSTVTATFINALCKTKLNFPKLTSLSVTFGTLVGTIVDKDFSMRNWERFAEEYGKQVTDFGITFQRWPENLVCFEEMVAPVANFSRLLNLTLLYKDLRFAGYILTSRVVKRIAHYCPFLESLELELRRCQGCLPLSSLVTLIGEMSRLRRLKFKIDLVEKDLANECLCLRGLQTCTNLKNFYGQLNRRYWLNSTVIKLDELWCRLFNEYAQKIECLTIEKFYSHALSYVSNYRFLKVLRIVKGTIREEETIINIIRRCPQLIFIEIGKAAVPVKIKKLTTATIDALVAHANSKPKRVVQFYLYRITSLNGFSPGAIHSGRKFMPCNLYFEIHVKGKGTQKHNCSYFVTGSYDSKKDIFSVKQYLHILRRTKKFHMLSGL